MTDNFIYSFIKEDIKKVIYFCKGYHLDQTKRSSGRTTAEKRGLGGVIDAFGPGKLNEIGIAKIIGNLTNKECVIDDEIYSDAEVGKKAKADIIKIKENNTDREPNLHIEAKRYSLSDQWIGMRNDQIETTIKVKGNSIENDMYIVFGEIFYDDEKNRKQQDFLGSFLKSTISDSTYSFGEFSEITNIKCKIKYVFSLKELKNLGHFFSVGKIIPKIELETTNNSYKKDGKLGWNLKKKRSYSDKTNISATTNIGTKTEYGKFKISGKFDLLGKKKFKYRRYIYCKSDLILKNEYLGNFNFKKDQCIIFNINNSLGTETKDKKIIEKTKSIDDWWISKNRLEQLIKSGKIKNYEKSLKEISEKI